MSLPQHLSPARPALVVLALLSTLLLVPTSGPATAADGAPDRYTARTERAEQALDRARTALAGRGGDPGSALRVLHRALPRLSAADPGGAAEARRLLARPTAGARDPRGDGYAVPATRRCTERVCLHWVRSTRDAPPDRAWARTSLEVVDDVLALQVDRMGYRAPLGDGRRGGDDRLDVYLADVGARGLFGYCAPEDPPGAGDPAGADDRTAAAYCVLDDDFARDQLGGDPRASLEVTAAHELFHAVQAAYDVGADAWLQESTATWMEERFADGADDNRRYLPYGQLRRTGVPLDDADPVGYAQYGNWVFWEHVTQRFDDDVVREVWEATPELDSVPALRSVLRARGTRLPLVLGRFAAANLAAAQRYREGADWPAPRPVETLRVTREDARAEVDVDHLSSATVVLRPGAADARLAPGTWALRIVVDGPPRERRPVAWVVVDRAGSSVLRRVRLDADGVGAVAVPVSARVGRVAVALVNGSSRVRDDQARDDQARDDQARDDGQRYVVEARLTRR